MEVMNEDVPIKKFHWMDVCIKCDKGGKLLSCNENGCPVVVHKDCLRCEAQFDEMGNFYCPYCVYKRAIQEFTQVERKAVLAEKTLSKYLDGKGVGTEPFETVHVAGSCDVRDQRVELEKDCQEVTGPECCMNRRDKEADVLMVNKESDVLQKRDGDNGRPNDDINHIKVVEKQNELEPVVRGRGNGCCSGEGKVDQQQDVDMSRRLQSEDKILGDANQTKTVANHHQDAEHLEAHKTREKNAEAIEENEGRRDDGQNQKQAYKATENIVCKESESQVHLEANRKVNDTTASTCMDTKAISEKVTGAQPPCVNTPRRSSREKKPIHIKKSSTPCKSLKVAKPPTIFTNLPTTKEKRKRLAWKVEEEEMLKEGVQKFSKTVNKNLPWHKILEEGHAVFDETRTPADLKDKWRNILSKEPLFEIS